MMIWSCPTCLSNMALQKTGLFCCHCQQFYPLLDGRIPILMPHFMNQIKETLSALREEHQKRLKQLLTLKKALKTASFFRLEQLQKLHDAYEHNNQLLLACIKTLTNIELKKTYPNAKNNISRTLGYHHFETCLNYLRRDWGNQSQSEEEIAIVNKRIQSLIHDHCITHQSALVVGAGLARYAHELAPQFGKTIAIDHSLSMAGFYHMLQKNDIEFYHIKLKNAVSNNQQIDLIRASSQKLRKQVNQTIHYAIADAKALPFQEQTLSAIISIYFTDVLPLHSFIPEVLRSLAPGGIFIHYGPLQYHFDQLADCFSAEELKKELFHTYGLILKDEQWHQLRHLNGRSFNNWSFAAIRQG